MAGTNKVKVVTGKVRFSFAHVFQPVAAVEGGTPKYSVSIIIPKSDTETVNKLNAAFQEAANSNAAFFKVSIAIGNPGDTDAAMVLSRFDASFNSIPL